MTEKTEVDIYEPTPAEGKLLEVLLDPANRHKNKKQIAELAEISREMYYKIFRKPEFVEYYRDRAKDLISEAVSSVINAAIREARCGSFQHQKMILEMAEMHQDSLALTGVNRGPVTVEIYRAARKKMLDDDEC